MSESPGDPAAPTPAFAADLPPLRAALEAILMVVEEPVDEGVLAQVLERPREEISATLHELAAGYDNDGRGFELRAIAGGWRFYSRTECAPYVERFIRDGQPTKLSQAALETLAVIAYRQPTTRSRVAGVRGVNVDAVIRTLLTRGLIAELGIERETGAILYGTTDHFLERLGLTSAEELPPLADYLPDHTALEDDVAAG
jgi:segregation and condensation protein B